MTPARDIAVRIVRTLREAGHIAYLAGGCVRDELLDFTPKDYDVATDATPERVAALFRGTREVGKSFGVMLVRLAGVTVEVTTFRREHGYTDRRRPDAVTFCDASSDAQRRDFTINALFIDPLAGAAVVSGRTVQGAVIDLVGGIKDLGRKTIRAVGDAEARLDEDNLRALRAVRFAARLGFTIERATAEAIRAHAAELAGVSRERIGDELRLMMGEANRAEAARLIEALGLDAPALEEAPRGGGALAALSSLPRSAEFSTALAAWALDRKGPEPDEPSLEALATRWRRALCLSNDERAALGMALHMVVLIEREWIRSSIARQKRAAATHAFGEALMLVSARMPGVARLVEARLAELEATPGGIAPPPFLTGDDLIEAGLIPGPVFGKWLDMVYDSQLEGRVGDRVAALRYAMELAGGSARPS